MTELAFLSRSLTLTLECNLVHGTNYRKYIGTTSVILVFCVVSHIYNPRYKEGPCIKRGFFLLTVLLSLCSFAKLRKASISFVMSVFPSVRPSVCPYIRME